MKILTTFKYLLFRHIILYYNQTTNVNKHRYYYIRYVNIGGNINCIGAYIDNILINGLDFKYIIHNNWHNISTQNII